MNDLEPTEFYLSQNYPNPFSERTTIKFCVAYKTKVRLEILDFEGESIKILVDKEKEAGTYEIEFNSSSGSSKLVNRVYYYLMEAGDFSTKKIMFLQSY